jgi:DGQHR domain-containing protein
LLVDKGALLNRRVWSLFEKAGFETEPSSQSILEHVVELSAQKKRPVDLYARAPDLGITIIGSNKSGKSIGSWTDHVNGCEEIARKAGASKFLFVLTGKEDHTDERKYVLEKDMAYWGEDELAYYEAVAEAIKSYAKFEIIHALGLSTKEEKDTHRVLAIRLRQPTSTAGTQLYMFTIAPERLLRTSVIYRRAQGDADAYQRMLRKSRLPDIRKFVTRTSAILPTNIIVHLNDKVTVDEVKADEFRDQLGRPITLSKASGDYDLVVLNVPMEYASLELIDGQHRLYGFVDADPATRQGFNLAVIGVKGLDVAQRRDTFIAINDNSRRMDPNLVSYLKYNEDDRVCQKDSTLMAIRIVVDLNEATPFRKAIRLLDVGKQRLTLKGLSGYDLRGLLGPKGLLRKRYPANLPEEYVRALRIYFSTIRSLFKKEWDDPDKYIIATNRGISAFLKLLKSILKTHKGPFTHNIVDKYLRALKAGWISSWEFSKLKNTYVGSQGWKQFHRDLVTAIRKKHPEFKE